MLQSLQLVGFENCFVSSSYIIPKNFTKNTNFFFTDRYFTKDHEWVTIDGGEATIGISDYAQSTLGEIVYVQLPDVAAEFSQGDECGALESVKAASDIVCPLSGKVFAKNSSVEEEPTKINSSPYEDGL